MQKPLLIPTLILILSVIQLINNAAGYPMINENSRQSLNGPSQQDQAPAITRFHDTLVLQQKKSKSDLRSGDKTRRSSDHKKYKLLPADDKLRNKYFSEKVEEDLGHVKINRLRRNEPVKYHSPNGQIQYGQQSSFHAPVPVPAPPSAASLARVPLTQQIEFPQNPPMKSHPVTLLDKERAQDLEEVFRILARRDGPLLEQMLSLRDAIDRFYGIFEFMGVAKMPPQQRDAAIRKILERTLTLDVEKAAKKA